MRQLFLVILAVLTWPLAALALEIRTQVHDLEISGQMDEPSLVFLASGHVAKLSMGNKFLNSLIEARDQGDWIRISLNNDREITHFELIEGPKYEASFEKGVEGAPVPTVLSSMTLARRLFKEARYSPRDSQCFNRAHVWSYEWKKRYQMNSSKVFIFFTPRYIREHNFHWWFHVAPLVHVAIGPDVKERVMDRKYLKEPTSIRGWIDTFMEKGTKCRTVKAYSEYASYPEAGECYLMRASMFTYWPLDLELEELRGVRKTGWVPDEIKTAYLDALGVDFKE